MTTAIWPSTAPGGPLVLSPSGPAFDAFGRLRVSNPQTVFDSKLVYDAQPLYWAEAQTGGAAAGVWAESTCTPWDQRQWVPPT